MKKLILMFGMMFLVVTSMLAQLGTSCSDPIPVDSNYVAIVSSPGTIWYTAWTYDLPLKVRFVPFSDNSQVSPQVEVDFTCTPGVYDDPKLDSLINMVEDFNVSVPMKFQCDLVVENGKNVWDLSINKTYRDQLTQFGILYNVQAFIKVVFAEGGNISLSPDTAFQSCMDMAKSMQLNDTMLILPNDSDRVFVVPYPEWQNDSIRFVWEGEGETKIYIAQQECEFEPNAFDPYVWDVYTLSKGMPYKLYSDAMKDAIKNAIGGGLLYAKVMASSPGRLVVEKIPMAAAEGGATLLQYGQSVQLPANNADALYCFPKTWTSTQFLTSTFDSVQMYVSATHEFQASADDANVLSVNDFDVVDGLSTLCLSTQELQLFAEKTAGNYIYVRFLSKRAALLTPSAWETSECVDNSVLLKPNVTKVVESQLNSKLYRFNYSDYSGYPITMKWSSTGDIKVYVADTCEFATSSNDPRVFYNSTIKAKKSVTVDADKVNSWASYVDADGFLYLRVYANKGGSLTFQTEKPAEPAPEDPCLSVLPLVVPASMSLSDETSENVYVMDVNSLTEQKVGFTWSAASNPVVIYFGATCVVPADATSPLVLSNYSVQTDKTLELTTDQLKKIAVDGQLYVRFVPATSGLLTIDYMKEPKPEPVSAVALVLDSTITITADDVVTTYYFTKDWANLSVEFEANSADSITAYFGKTADFNIFGREADYVAAYPFYVENNQSRLQFSAKQINTLLSSNAADTLFVVFYSYNATQVTPILWNVCACVENSMELMPVDRKVLLSLTYNDVYRVKYSEWQKHDVRLHWNSDVALRAYLADTCDFKLTPKNKHVLNKSNVDILPNDTMIIGEEVRTLVINEGRLPDDGFLYFRFYSQDSGILTTSYPGSSDPGNGPGPGTGVDNTMVGDALRRIICTPDGTIYILVGEDRYTILGEKL